MCVLPVTTEKLERKKKAKEGKKNIFGRKSEKQ